MAKIQSTDSSVLEKTGEAGLSCLLARMQMEQLLQESSLQCVAASYSQVDAMLTTIHLLCVLPLERKITFTKGTQTAAPLKNVHQQESR